MTQSQLTVIRRAICHCLSSQGSLGLLLESLEVLDQEITANITASPVDTQKAESPTTPVEEEFAEMPVSVPEFPASQATQEQESSSVGDSRRSTGGITPGPANREVPLYCMFCSTLIPPSRSHEITTTYGIISRKHQLCLKCLKRWYRHR